MRLIATDLDGTLLNHKSEISENNLKALKYAQKLGIKIVISTGRIYSNAKDICDRSGLSNYYIISNNGATIHDVHGNIIQSIPIYKSDVKQIIDWLDTEKYFYELCTSQFVYIPSGGKELLSSELSKIIDSSKKSKLIKIHEFFIKQFDLPYFKPLITSADVLDGCESYYDILIFSFDENKTKLALEHFDELDTINKFKNNNHAFEIVNKNCSKGNALELLCNILNIPLSETAAFGDNYNDVSMFEKAGISIAMGNAKEDIKALCKVITKDNLENGVAYGIYDLINSLDSMDLDA